MEGTSGADRIHRKKDSSDLWEDLQWATLGYHEAKNKQKTDNSPKKQKDTATKIVWGNENCMWEMKIYLFEKKNEWCIWTWTVGESRAQTFLFSQVCVKVFRIIIFTYVLNKYVVLFHE